MEGNRVINYMVSIFIGGQGYYRLMINARKPYSYIISTESMIDRIRTTIHVFFV